MPVHKATENKPKSAGIRSILRKNYVLASVSPRRIQLLEMLGLNFVSIGSGVEEIDSASNPVLTVKRNALAKSREVAFKFQNEIVIGADTIVVLGKHTLNKPANLKQAKEYLRRLSG
ncbi:MAG: Maf family protein, partial [Ignavibacteria bacterium]